MLRALSLSVALTTLTTTACVDLEPELGTDSQAVLVADQKYRLQGMRLQGMRLQGMRLQGMRLQGMRLQGMRLQGMRLQGGQLIAQLVSRFSTEYYFARNHYSEVGGKLEGPFVGGLEGNATIDAVLPNGDQFELLLASSRVDDSTNTMVNEDYASNDDLTLWEVVVADEFEFCRTPEQDIYILSEGMTPGPEDVCRVVQAGTNICGAPDKHGNYGEGLFVSGTWDETGTWSSGGTSFSCTSGVVAKCVREWGYKPWKTYTDSHNVAHSMRDFHLPCTRAARADYKGDGESFTKDDTKVDIYDNYGFNQKVGEDHPTLMAADEAVFNKDGAWFMSTVRYQDLLDENPGSYDPTTVDELGEDEYVADLLEYGFAALKSWIDYPLDGEEEAYKYSAHIYEIGVETTTYCTHPVCETGAPLADSCNTCTRQVCADEDHAYCCYGHGWLEGCVDFAHEVCSHDQAYVCD